MSTSFEVDDALAASKAYQLAYGNWKLSQLYLQQLSDQRPRPNAKSLAAKAAQACVRHARRAVEQDAALAEALAIEAACEAHSATARAGSAGCANSKPLRTAAGLAPDNPRIKLVQAMCAPNTAADPAAIDRWRAVVASFEAAPPSRPGKPDWGHVEALTMLGETYLQRGDPVAARDALERALVLAPDYRQAQQLLQAAASQAALNYTVHVNRRQLPSFMSPQLQLFDARGAADRWTVRVSGRARRLSVRVYPGGRVEVVVPPGASPAAVQKFIGTHRQWIHRRVEDLSTAAAADETAIRRRSSCRRSVVTIAVEYEHAGESTARVRVAGENVLVVSGPLHDDRAIAAALAQLARGPCARISSAVSSPKSPPKRDFRYVRTQIRRQRTRWGSCSASGTISLNVCLLFLRPQVVRYLLLHELCHTRHMNHSATFWALVESLEPDYRALDRELLRGWQSVPGWMFS